MGEKGKWRGIQANFALFQGEIVSDPVQSGDYMFLTLRTVIVQLDSNGQFTEVDQDIPLMVEPGGPVGVVQNYVKAGRKLMAWCHYKTWEIAGGTHHAFVIRKLDLGDKPYEGPAAGSTPPPVTQ